MDVGSPLHPSVPQCCLLQKQGSAERKGLQKFNSIFLLALELLHMDVTVGCPVRNTAGSITSQHCIFLTKIKM